MSIIDIAFSAVNKISVRRLLDSPKGQSGAPSLVALLENQARSAHVHPRRDPVAACVRRSVVVRCLSATRDSVRWRRARHDPRDGVRGSLYFGIWCRELSPCVSPEIVLIKLFPVFKIIHYIDEAFFASSECRRCVTSISWEEEIEPAKEEEASEAEIQAFIDAGQEEGILERGEGEMIQSIVHFGAKVARELMTPRTQIVAIDINDSVDALLHLILRNGMLVSQSSATISTISKESFTNAICCACGKRAISPRTSGLWSSRSILS